MDILKSPFITDVTRTCSNMYRLGWDERNSGNISYILNSDEVKEYIDVNGSMRKIKISFNAQELAGKIFLVTGTGKYFKNVEYEPEVNLGIIKICGDGVSADLLWGFSDGGNPTSELPAHFMCHIERLKKNPLHRVVMHTHSTNTLAMTYIHDLDEREFTRTLWRYSTECIVVFPDGVGVLPWMLCGNEEIGRLTADKMKEFRLCVWAMHGIFGTGESLDEAFGLIETVEKSAEIYNKTRHRELKNVISDTQLRTLADAFGAKPKNGWLD